MAVIRITEAHELRDALFTRLIEPNERSEYAAQHDVWPCVRKGAAERWLSERGETFPPSKSAGLYFLRGKSAEAIITRSPDPQEMTVYRGVSVHPDLNRADLERLFDGAPLPADITVGEIKSTNFSSFAFYEIVRQGGIDAAMLAAFKMHNYIEQGANYCVATGTKRFILIVFFLHGDYADRRTKCPACSGALGPWVDDFYKTCTRCGYKSKKLDLWVYTVEPDADTMARVERDVYGTRPAQFYAAAAAPDEAGVLAAAPPTPCFYCRSCRVGERIGCGNAGVEFE